MLRLTSVQVSVALTLEPATLGHRACDPYRLYFPIFDSLSSAPLTEPPKTILSPPWLLVLKLAPQDGPHPLYSNTPANAALRADLILDYLATPQVRAQDTRITLPQGLTVTNMGGNELVFKAGTEGTV